MSIVSHIAAAAATVLLTCLSASASAQTQAPRQPLYMVNGVPADDLHDIQPDDIVTTEMLPADEDTVARYGERANNGVIIVSLRYDTPARFVADDGESGGSFADYIARHVEWGELERVARYVARFTVREDGTTAIGRELESTDPRLRRKVLRAVSKSPRWQPAMKDGRPVESSHVLRIQLPEGREMPRERIIPY